MVYSGQNKPLLLVLGIPFDIHFMLTSQNCFYSNFFFTKINSFPSILYRLSTIECKKINVSETPEKVRHRPQTPNTHPQKMGFLFFRDGQLVERSLM